MRGSIKFVTKMLQKYYVIILYE